VSHNPRACSLSVCSAIHGIVRIYVEAIAPAFLGFVELTEIRQVRRWCRGAPRAVRPSGVATSIGVNSSMAERTSRRVRSGLTGMELSKSSSSACRGEAPVHTARSSGGHLHHLYRRRLLSHRKGRAELLRGRERSRSAVSFLRLSSSSPRRTDLVANNRRVENEPCGGVGVRLGGDTTKPSTGAIPAGRSTRETATVAPLRQTGAVARGMEGKVRRLRPKAFRRGAGESWVGTESSVAIV